MESQEIDPEVTESFMEDVEVVPEADDWDLVTDEKIIVNPYDEKAKEDVIADERAKEVSDLNKIIELTSTDPKPSGTTALRLFRRLHKTHLPRLVREILI